MEKEITHEKANQLIYFLKLGAIDPKPKDKLSYGVARLLEQLEKKSKSYNKKMADIGAKYCLTDKEDGSLLMYPDNKGYKLDPAKTDEYSKEIETLNEKKIKIDTWIVPPIKRVTDLPIDMLMIFNDILFEIDLEKMYCGEESDKGSEAPNEAEATLKMVSPHTTVSGN